MQVKHVLTVTASSNAEWTRMVAYFDAGLDDESLAVNSRTDDAQARSITVDFTEQNDVAVPEV